MPRRIEYDWARWQKSISIKARLFRTYGIDETSRVAVCHPFSPWAMGPVFAEGALACGASVLPLGLEAGRPEFQRILLDFAPTHICATARNLIRWSHDIGKSEGVIDRYVRRLAFVAGERLTTWKRRRASEFWNATIVDVYGMAEFDMVGAELPGREGLCLVPEFSYSVLEEGCQEPRPLTTGAIGELSIRESSASPWHMTGDLIEVVEHCNAWASDHMSWSIRFIERVDESATFADGSLLLGSHVRIAREGCAGLETLQVIVHHMLDGDYVDLLCVASDDVPVDLAECARHALLASNIDMSDALKHGIIRQFNSRMVTDDQLVHTPRGKIPSVIEMEVEGD